MAETAPVGQMYKLLLEVANRYGASGVDRVDLESEVSGADDDLSFDIEYFRYHVLRLQKLKDKGADIDDLMEAVVQARLFAMNLSSLFSNLVDSIDEVVFRVRDGDDG